MLTILCVDDDKTVLLSLRTLLTNTIGGECRVEIAESGQEALEICEELARDGIEPFLIICDYIMPSMRGDELLVKLHERFPEMVKVMLTGQSDFSAIKRVINEASLYRFLDKPFKNVDMVLTVKKAIEGRETLVSLRASIRQLEARIAELERASE